MVTKLGWETWTYRWILEPVGIFYDYRPFDAPLV